MKEIEESIGKANVFKEKVYLFTDITKGIIDRRFMLDIENNDIDKNIKKIVEKFIGKVVIRSLRVIFKHLIYPIKIFMLKMGNKSN